MAPTKKNGVLQSKDKLKNRLSLNNIFSRAQSIRKKHKKHFFLNNEHKDWKQPPEVLLEILQN